MNETELVALRYPNRRFAERLAQLWDEGAAVLPISPELPEPQVESLLGRFRPSRIEDASGQTRLPDGIPVASGIALVVPTSGSSGRPKGVELSHEALEWSAGAVNRQLGVDAERWLVCLPLTHIAGIGILVRSAAAGSIPVIHEGFDVDAVAGEKEASLISLVPTTLQRLIDAGADLSRYRAVLVGGGPVPMPLIHRAHALGIPAIRTYGMTETCGGCIYDGFPFEGVEMKIEDEQILLKGPMTMDRYRLDAGLTEQVLQNGWFRTSDRGTIDPSGKLEVFGRIDDVIVTGGEKVSATEIEELLKQHPLVADAAVVGLEDPEWGQIVAALIVPSGPETPSVEELKTLLGLSIPHYARPKRIEAVKALPRSATGKISRGDVRRLLLKSVGQRPIP
jgi:O-succinylbenzoic acid--CoA ligase